MTMAATATGGWRRWIGLVAGPGLWAVSTQAKYAVVQTTCPGSSGLISLVVGAATAALVVVAGAISWRAWDWAGARGDSNGRFLSALSALTALLFALSILLQGAAGFVFSDCHR
jgi:hypothetical protein